MTGWIVAFLFIAAMFFDPVLAIKGALAALAGALAGLLAFVGYLFWVR